MKPVIMYKNEALTFSNYKEPLKAIPKGEGFGYYGCLLATLDNQSIQCHICGKLYACLALHVYQTHKMRVKVYKEKFGLSPMTALVSENQRQLLKERTLQWLASLTPKEKADYAAKRKEWSRKGFLMRSKGNPKITLETKNKRGTCPDQLIAKIHEVAKKLGKTPTLAEFIDVTGGQRYKHIIFATFGSWLNALKMANLEARERERNLGKKKKHYSNEELLEYLRIYAQENRKLPTATDSKRFLIPSYENYQRHFGTFEKARRLAGVYDLID